MTDLRIPRDHEIRVIGIGTESVMGWPIYHTEIQTVIVGTNTIAVGYQRLEEFSWPYVTIPLFPEDPEYIGTIWLVWRQRDGTFVAWPAEHLHTERERNETTIEREHMRAEGGDQPEPGQLIGVMITGPARGVRDRKEYRRRGPIDWFLWEPAGILKRYVEEEPPPPPPPPPVDPPCAGYADEMDDVRKRFNVIVAKAKKNPFAALMNRAAIAAEVDALDEGFSEILERMRE